MSRGAPFDGAGARARLLGLAASLGAEPPSEPALLACLSFAERTWVWNRRTNLTGAKDQASLVALLFADALALAPWVEEGARLIDVGSGGGAPGLSLLLLRPDLFGLLVEPRSKRAAFLRTSLAALGPGAALLGRAAVHEGRIELEGPPSLPLTPAPSWARAPFDLALSRATFAPEDWLPLGLRLAPSVALFSAESLPEAPPGVVRRARSYTHPGADGPRTLGLYQRKE